MSWRNLRSEIGDMFAYYARGEELSEYAQSMWAKRHSLAVAAQRLRDQKYYQTHKGDPVWKESHRLACARWWAKAKQNPDVQATRRAYRKANYTRLQEKKKLDEREKRYARWADKPAQYCAYCGQSFKRPHQSGPPQKYCQARCRWNAAKRRGAP